MEKVRVFILPSAGSLGYEYNLLRQEYAEQLDIIVIKYHRELRLNSLQELVNAVYEQIENMLDRDYVILGHSMGGILAYELYYKIHSLSRRLPYHMYFVASQSPAKSIIKRSNLCDKEFESFFIALGGISAEVLQADELKTLVFSSLRSDIKLLDSYEFKERPLLIDCPATILSGNLDEKIDIKSWKRLIKGDISEIAFEGNHFFIFKKFHDIAKIILYE